MRPHVRALSLAVAMALTPSAFGFSQVKPADRLLSPIVASQRTVTNPVHPLATRQNDVGRVTGSHVFQRMILLLQRSPEQETALRQLLADQQDPKSPQYHKWLTPTQFGQQFGPSDADLAKVQSWLQAQGFSVEKPSIGRQFLEFTGTSAQVETAFQTQMHTFSIGGKAYFANATPASIPTALAPAVKGVASLTSIGRITMKPQYHMAANPKMQIGGSALTGPADLAAIYDATPLQKNQVEGQGQSVALIEESNIDPQDVTDFRTVTGLPTAKLNVIVNGPDPGQLWSDGEETEAIADVEYAGSLAPDATLNVIVTESTDLNQGIDYSMVYAVDYDVSPITSLSYGGCEAMEADSGNLVTVALYGAAYEQGAAEGISHFVSAGDNGGDACGNLGAYGVSAGYGVNAIGNSLWNVSVGGTEFIMPDPDTYFPPANNYLATGYIPESTWNDYQNPQDGRPLAGGGGASIFYPKPDWQAGPGVPADGRRDLPDVSLLAGDNLSYMVCQRDMGADCSSGQAVGVTGTSLASPSWASIQALVNQKNALMNGAGNPNPTYYQLAAGKNSPFHDITAGDTKVPDANGTLIGYPATAGYDLATGLGSVDVNALATSWMPPTGSGQTTVTLDTGGVTTITHGDPITANFSVAPVSGTTIPSGNVVLMAGTEGAYRQTLDANGNGTVVFGSSGVGTELPGGTYNLAAHYGGDANFAPSDSSPIALTVNPEPTYTTVFSNETAPQPFGAPILLGAQASGLNSGSGTVVSGVYTFTENGNTLGTSSMLNTGEEFGFLKSNLATFISLGGPSALPVGIHFINASSPPASASFLASTSLVPAAVAVTKGAVLATLSPDHTSPTLNSVVNFQISAVNLSGPGAPVTGKVELIDATTPPGVVVASGTLGTMSDQAGAFHATLSASFASAGPHTLIAGYVGDANNYGALSGAVDLNVGAATGGQVSTSTTIGPGAGLVDGRFALGGNNVSISAMVAGDTGGSAPTGTVTFTDAANKNAVVGTAAVGTNGTATLTTKTLAGGKHYIVANYSGDSNFATSASQSIEVDIADFSVSDSPSSVTVTAGQSASVTFTYSGAIDFTKLPGAPGTGSVGVSCSGLPQGAQCSFSNAVITPTAGSGGTTSGSVTVTITTTGPSLQVAANQAPHRPLGNVPPLALAGLFAIGLPLIFRKRRTFTVLLGLLLLAVVGTLNGCNGGSTTYSISNPGTVPGTSNVSVTASFNGGPMYGTLSHTATVALIVAPEPTH